MLAPLFEYFSNTEGQFIVVTKDVWIFNEPGVLINRQR